jgi:hypothetical protein
VSAPVQLVTPAQRENDARQQNIVMVLESALAEARAGRFDAVTIVAVTPGDDNFVAFSKAENRLKMVGVLEFAKHRMMRNYEDTAETAPPESPV